MSNKTLAERAAEYQLRRFDGRLDSSGLTCWNMAEDWRRANYEHLKAYVAAESECEQLRNENERLRAALHRLGHEVTRD